MARRRGAHRAPVCGPADRPRRARGIGARPLRRIPACLGGPTASAHARRRQGLAALLGLVAGRRAGLATTEHTASETAPAKIRRVLPRHLARRLDTLLEALAFTDQPGELAHPDAGLLLTVADAVRHRRPVSIRYTDRDGRRSERTLHAYGIVAHAGRWCGTGKDAQVGDDRTLRLDRIAAARTLPGSF